MIAKGIVWFGRPCVLACDAKCEKAWGINSRPQTQLSDDPDDYAFHADGELGIAPADPGTYEGEHGKPQRPDERLNKWCARECERSAIGGRGEIITLTDFSVRRFNMPHLHAERPALERGVSQRDNLSVTPEESVERGVSVDLEPSVTTKSED